MYWRTLSAAAVAALTLTATATAGSKASTRSLSDSHVGTTKTELVAQRDFSSKVVTRLAHSWRFAPRHRSCWSHVPWSKLCDSTRREVFTHRWLEHVAMTRLEHLYPSHPVVAGNGGEFECIHLHEGAWDSNTGNGFYGGLQEDLHFQSTYGAEFVARWGTADHWPMWAQVIAARRARDGYAGFGPRGYSPWPNTARACGLL